MDRNRDAQSWRSSILQNGSTEEHPRPLIGRPGSRRVKELRQPTVNSPVSLGVAELLLQSVNSSRSGLTVAGPQRQQLVHLLAETNQRLASLLLRSTQTKMPNCIQRNQPAMTFYVIMKDTYLINGSAK